MNDRDNKHDGEEELREAVELTPAEKQAMATLPLDRIPNAALEDRVVGALRRLGLLHPPRRRVIELTTWRIAAVVAAGLVLLAGGFTFGQWMGTRHVTGGDFTSPQPAGISEAATLQQAGSAYLLALQRFAELPDSVDGDQAVQGREVALTTLCTAADQVTRLVPKKELAKQLLVALNSKTPVRSVGAKGAAAIGGRDVIDF
jgi:hypothetical protein